jgi:quercetin 2,3-dioxygenase
VPVEENILLYVVRGNVYVNSQRVTFHQLVEFNNDAEKVTIKAETDAVVLLGHALPLNEPVVAQGPFVMNTEEEIVEAYQDYREGKFGQWV